MRIKLGFLGLVVTVVATAGFAASAGAERDGSAVTTAAIAQSAQLTGKVWVLTSLSGKPPLRATVLTAEFTDGKTISGSSGCNRYSGRYSVSGNKLRVTGPLASTQRACAKAIMSQEASFQKALLSARSYEVSGATLTLRSAGGKVVLRFKAQTQQLVGTSWMVVAYNNGKQAVVSVLTGTKLTATFSKDGNVGGFAGCNDYNATYKSSAPKLTVGPVTSTRKHCAEPAGVMEQETAYLAALQTSTTYRIEGRTLELRTTGGALAVELQRK